MKPGETQFRFPGPPLDRTSFSLELAFSEYTCDLGAGQADAEARAKALHAYISDQVGEEVTSADEDFMQKLDAKNKRMKLAEKQYQCVMSDFAFAEPDTRTYRYTSTKGWLGNYAVKCHFIGSEASTQARANQVAAIIDAPIPSFDAVRSAAGTSSDRAAAQTKLFLEKYNCDRSFS